MMVDLSICIFNTVNGEFGVYFPDEVGQVSSPAVIDYAPTRNQAIRILEDFMKRTYPTFKYFVL